MVARVAAVAMKTTVSVGLGKALPFSTLAALKKHCLNSRSRIAVSTLTRQVPNVAADGSLSRVDASRSHTSLLQPQTSASSALAAAASGSRLTALGAARQSSGASFGSAFASSMSPASPWQPESEPAESLCRVSEPWPAGPYVPITQAARLPVIVPWAGGAAPTRKQIWRAQNKDDDFEIFI
mmetsp:Transcript_51236/g.130378  ORF Transcript_51236/g.130378 Transcript_51236/m.130378 type:complete len:182 (+) Transcript_51236:93-638(+)